MKKLGFGTMRLPLLDSKDASKIDLEQYKKMVDLFIEKGFNYFDAAYVYHGKQCEKALKAALVDRYPRDKFMVATKLHFSTVNSVDDPDKILNEQLSNTGLIYFDNYLIHCVMKTNYHDVYEKYDCFNWIFKKKEQGLIKNAGFSFHDSPELLDEILTKYPDFDFVQLQINYLDWDATDIQSRKCYEVARKHNKKVIIMEPVKGGALINLSNASKTIFDKLDPTASIASWAIRFAASLEGVWFVLSGMSTYEQMVDNLSFMEDFKPMSQEEIDACHKVAEIIESERVIKCTKCSYCTAGCPMKIQIPDLFEMYNNRMKAISAGTIGRAKESYQLFIKEHAKASDCIKCGQCENACPQHLTIRDYLDDIAKEFE